MDHYSISAGKIQIFWVVIFVGFKFDVSIAAQLEIIYCNLSETPINLSGNGAVKNSIYFLPFDGIASGDILKRSSLNCGQ